MSDNPRFFLAGFWLITTLRCAADLVDAMTAFGVFGNLAGLVACPVLAYAEIKQGLADRKARKVVRR